MAACAPRDKDRPVRCAARGIAVADRPVPDFDVMRAHGVVFELWA
jgi:hypothetical protein